MTAFLLPALIYLAAAVVMVPIFKRIGLGSVLGYLAAGLIIGPWGLGLVTEFVQVQQISELGVVLLLFLVGLELNPKRLWALRHSIFGLGLLQVLMTVAATAAIASAFGMGLAQSLVVGMACAMSSTAIALQVLAERNLVSSSPGQAAFSVSLFQDLAVIPMLLVLALLAPAGSGKAAGIDWWPALAAVALVATMVVAGRLLLRPLLRLIAGVGQREVFVAFALLLVVGSATLTSSVGLSLGLGSFIAGVLLADSEYRMELEVDIEPFKGLLLGLFFMSVGMAIDVGMVAAKPGLVVLIAISAVALKILLLAALARGFGMRGTDTWVFAIALAHVGEFAFLLLAGAQAVRVFTPPQAALLNAAVAVSMLATPVLFAAFPRWIAPRLARSATRAADPVDERKAVIVAGFGRFGQIVVRLLLGRGIPVTIIDHDPNQIELMRRFGWRSFYGDASRPDVLEAAGVAQARLLVLALDDPATVQRVAEHCRRTWPSLQLVARARSRPDAYALARLGVPAVRETFGSALDAGEMALRSLGHGAYQARRIVHRFREHDERQFAAQMAAQSDQQQLIELVQRGRVELERLLKDEAQEFDASRSTGRQVEW